MAVSNGRPTSSSSLNWSICCSWPIGTRGGWMKTGTCRSCAHSQNAKESSPSMKRPCQLEQISRPLNFERRQTAFAFGDMVLVERIDRTQAPIAVRARNDARDAVVDRLADVERRRFRDRGHHLGRERRRDDPAGDAGLGTGFLLQIEIPHLVVGDGRQPTVIGHHVSADRRAAQRLRNAEAVIGRWRRRAVLVDVDDWHLFCG